MAKIICLLALSLSVALGSPIESRIVGGSTVDISRYPYLVAVLYSQDSSVFRHICGGSIINNRSVLTAAHCLVGSPSNYRLRAGSSFGNSGGRTYNVMSMNNHFNYEIMTANNDIGMIRITSTFLFGGNVQVGRIGGYHIGDNQVVWAAGWGYTSFNGQPSEELRHVQIWTVNQNICQQNYMNIPIPDSVLCAGPRVANNGICSGDSGGPLAHNNVIVGVVSRGANCGLPQFPGIFTRVSKYTDWIQTNA
ncbi:trypsin, alkaline B-like [Vanessa atalanta]|uniref:trypsin, alkaline B-like n=1 Tax=Vanessa atalanta TaxID=42275 RepID=UPI001FCD371B|nr:trypsin, alkaline B-like [Vanessa atalanta]